MLTTTKSTWLNGHASIQSQGWEMGNRSSGGRHHVVRRNFQPWWHNATLGGSE